MIFVGEGDLNAFRLIGGMSRIVGEHEIFHRVRIKWSHGVR